MKFSRLECKEILQYVDQSGIDPDVLDKLVEGAGNVRYAVQQAPVHAPLKEVPGRATLQSMEADLTELQAARDRRNEPPVMVLDARLEALGYTQEDVDAVNEQRRSVYAAQARMKDHTPIVGEANAGNINADFAQPDGATGKPIGKVEIGEKNAAGDACIKYDGDGKPVFGCKNGHAYNQSPYMAGCPQCFVSNGGSLERRTADDEEQSPTEDTRW